MRLPELTPTELADLLARAYSADHGEQSEALPPEQRTALADYLGCHDDARDAAFAVWCTELDDVTEDEAAYWLDIEFITPCPESGVPSGNDALEQRAPTILRDGLE